MLQECDLNLRPSRPLPPTNSSHSLGPPSTAKFGPVLACPYLAAQVIRSRQKEVLQEL